MSVDGSTAPEMIAQDSGLPIELLLPRDRLYWASRGGPDGDRVNGLDLTSLAVEQIANLRPSILSAALGNDLYWINLGTFSDNGGTYDGNGALTHAPR